MLGSMFALTVLLEMLMMFWKSLSSEIDLLSSEFLNRLGRER